MNQEVSTKDLFRKSNDMAGYVARNPIVLSRYLTTAANCRHYTVSNQLLILTGLSGINGNIPQLVLSENEWNNYGVEIPENTTPIWIMEHAPRTEYNYIPRDVYDISQTNYTYEKPKYEAGSLAEMLYIVKPCKLEINNDLKVAGTRCFYRASEDVIQVRQGFKSFEDLFMDLSKEYYHYYFNEKVDEKPKNSNNPIQKPIYNRANYMDDVAMSCMITAYHFGIIDKISIEKMPAVFGKYMTGKEGKNGQADMDTNKIKKALGNIVEGSYSVMDGIDKLIQQQERVDDYAR